MTYQISRRAFIKSNSLILLTTGSSFLANPLNAKEETESKALIKVGLLTDIHYADKSPAGSRHYRESLTKIDAAINHFKKIKPEFVVELGDLVDAASTVEEELGYLKKINAKFKQTCKNRHYVLGNHCVDTLTKKEFLSAVGQEKSYYSFDKNGHHFIVLDACFRHDGVSYQRKNFKWTDTNIPEQELNWLKSDLKNNSLPTVVFAHQRLDIKGHHAVKNAPEVRKILEESGNVLLVLQGHNHVNSLKDLNGIHYCTHAAMIEGSGEKNNAYSVMEIMDDKTIQIHGFKNQKNQKMS